ncbi:HIT domain-containing protein [Streptomyces sp. RKND-216]|uniref:HIT family protein n=1 Tax=Streptomyces sp. RKND-216 TaxID=2562581 RepID=UPI00109D832B|nr:HIT domain-containing protein [Streptomyces sp. RKND-216]THA27398.1 HIT domain-containing protein [Streptomyces sp. RKND-216]
MGDSPVVGGSVASPGCVFCRVVAGHAPAHRVLEDATAVAFLDTRPLFHGHVLVVPRRHAETLTDLTEDELGPFFARVRRTTAAVEDALGAAGTFVAANNRVSQSVPHFHVHVVPRNRKDGLRGFFWPRTRYADEAEAENVAARLRAALAAADG